VGGRSASAQFPTGEYRDRVFQPEMMSSRCLTIFRERLAKDGGLYKERTTAGRATVRCKVRPQIS
jgi:hypothetical protein